MSSRKKNERDERMARIKNQEIIVNGETEEQEHFTMLEEPKLNNAVCHSSSA